MDRIYKYDINIVSEQILELPVEARILTVTKQRDTVVLYAIIDDSGSEKERRVIERFVTVHPMADDVPRNYIGTVSQENGYLVWHVFERLERYDGTSKAEVIV